MREKQVQSKRVCIELILGFYLVLIANGFGVMQLLLVLLGIRLSDRATIVSELGLWEGIQHGYDIQDRLVCYIWSRCSCGSNDPTLSSRTASPNYSVWESNRIRYNNCKVCRRV